MKLDQLTRRCQQFMGKFSKTWEQWQKQQKEQRSKQFEIRLKQELGEAQFEYLKEVGQLPAAPGGRAKQDTNGSLENEDAEEYPVKLKKKRYGSKKRGEKA